MFHGKGFGKVILFGEHFVVYGLPAIVSALGHTLQITIELSHEYELVDKSIKFPGVPPLTWGLCQKPIKKVCDYFGITTPLQITIHGNLPISHGGIGSSAAICVALARAINNHFNLQANDEIINEAAYIGEKEIHGNPSGIDNTASTYGGMFLFTRNVNKKNIIKKIALKKPIKIVLIESGVPTKTAAVIKAVKHFKEQNQKKTKYIFNEYKKIVIQAEKALQKYDLKTVGQLMNKNHELLQQLTVSCTKLDELVRVAREAGAFGAKLTGTGRGGLLVALTPGVDLQKHVATVFEKKGFSVLPSRLSNNLSKTSCVQQPYHF